ncbi:MAG TPA: T9SS type A sorting domain-containing protein, partial [Puia sp.]|nr:T9SS type A sorting domain-containing protein [Puia sp.]
SGVYVFQLTVTDSSGLSSTANVQVRVVDNQRIADTGSARFMVYPNPVPSTLTVKFTDPATSGQVLIRIINMKGNTVLTAETQVSGGGQLTNFNVSALARGVYTLQVIAGQKQSYQLIVKQ